jgi:hypothetical protein
LPSGRRAADVLLEGNRQATGEKPEGSTPSLRISNSPSM